MFRRRILYFFEWMNWVLNQPKKIFVALFSLVAISMVVDGTLIQLWTLSQAHDQGEMKIQTLQNNIAEIDIKIQKAQKLEFIEREARDRFDLVEEGDLVFVFTDVGDPDEGRGESKK